MIPLTFLIILVVYIVIAWFAAKGVTYAFESDRAKKIAKVLTLIAFVLIPTWDIIPGKLYFDHLCKTEGGLKIYKTVEGVDGVYQKEGGSGVALSTLKYGYKFVEGTSLDGSLMKYTLDVNEKLVQERIPKVASTYVVERIIESRIFNIHKTNYRIANVRTGEQLAAIAFLSHSGNWLQVKFAPLLGHGGNCPLPTPSFQDFYLNTLKPKQ